MIENEELKGFIKDLMDFLGKVRKALRRTSVMPVKLGGKARAQFHAGYFEERKRAPISHKIQFIPSQNPDTKDIEEFQSMVMEGCDSNNDGKINKCELTTVLLALAKHASGASTSSSDSTV